MSNRSEYHKQYRLKNKGKLNDYHKKYSHINKNNDIEDKQNIEQNEKIEFTTEPIKKYDFTEKRKLAYEKMREARKKKIEDMRNRKIEDKEKIPPPPKLKRSRAVDMKFNTSGVDMKQEIIKSSSESSTSTDSSNYESDEKTEKVIIHNYDENEPESKLIIKKVRRKNKINHEELKKNMMM